VNRPEPIVAPGAPDPSGHYAHATVTPDGTIRASAQLPLGNGLTPGSPAEAQARQVLTNLAAVIRAAGGTVASIAKLTLYVTDITDWGAVDAAVRDLCGDHRPARAVLQVAGLHHGFRVAADAVAWRVCG